MAIDFPASPNLNDAFTSGGITYTWDGTVWAASGTAGFLSTGAIGTTVQAYDANLPAGNTILVDGDVGTTVQAYDANLPAGNTILVDGDIGSTVQAYDADNVVADVVNTFTAEQTFNAGLSVDGAYEQVAEAVGALDIDLSTGNYFTKSISTSSTITFSNPPASGTVGSFTLELALTGASTAITWPASVYWNDDAGQTAPTLTDARTHLFVFVTSDGGTTYRGAVLKNYTA